jgi:excisionase family DNA binding protein
MSNMPQPPEGSPSMPRHTTRPVPKPPRPRRRASLLQTAERLAVAERTARQMIYDGRLKGYRLGRTVRVDLNEVDDALLPFGGN